jgi:hypothetical protein
VSMTYRIDVTEACEEDVFRVDESRCSGALGSLDQRASRRRRLCPALNTGTFHERRVAFDVEGPYKPGQ